MSYAAKPDVTAFIDTAEWLSSVFAAPLSARQVTHGAAMPGQAALGWMGEQMDAIPVTQVLSQALAKETPESVATHLQRHYTALFEGIFRHKSVLPYESAWCQSEVAPAAQMDATLRALDLHVSDDVCEPSDHLAIELATLAAALRDDKRTIAADLVRRLQGWVPGFTTALAQKDTSGFYDAAGQLLLALIRKMTAVFVTSTLTAAQLTERHEGESI